MSDTIDAEMGMEEPLLSQESQETRTDLDDADEAEKWRKKANAQIDSVARVFWAIAILSILGILFCCIAMYDLGELLTYVVVILVASAALALVMHRRIEYSSIYVDDDQKNDKKKRQEESERRVWVLFLLFSAFLVTLAVLWSCIFGLSGSAEIKNSYLTHLPPS